MSKHESPEEVQLRLHHEKECRRIAELVKGELPADRLFVLVTASLGGGPGAPFSSTDYVSTMQREDAGRLLTELLDHWRVDGTLTEPSIQTATTLREEVFRLRDVPIEKLLHVARCSVRDLESATRLKDQHRSGVEAMKTAAMGLAILDRVLGVMFREEQKGKSS